MKHILWVILFTLGFTACSTTALTTATPDHSLTRQGRYPKMYEEKPVSILVMPPINNTTQVDAKEQYYTSLSRPLCDKGYYVLPPMLALEALKSESGYDSELFLESDLKKFHQYFGADAVLFTSIEHWGKLSLVGIISVSLTYTLKSTKTNEILFERTSEVHLITDSSTDSDGDGEDDYPLATLIFDTLKSLFTPELVAARISNAVILQDLPCGFYSPKYQRDQLELAGEKDLFIEKEF